MIILPAIDLKDGKAVRLLKGDYNKLTVYNENPLETAMSFENDGAKNLHIVDLDGAKDGTTANFDVIKKIAKSTKLSTEVGGGIRSEEVINKYLDIGVSRVILGTIAVSNPGFTERMIKKYGDKIAVGVDIKNDMVAVHGWTEVSDVNCFDFCKKLENMGVATVICTDISKDGALMGTNMDLYKKLSEQFKMNFIASGGITTIQDVEQLNDMKMYGAILGKAIYTGNIILNDAIRVVGGAKK